MPNLIDVSYPQTGRRLSVDGLGMRDMQAKAFEARGSRYLLIKAPPASGKSRALMFLALDKLFNQGIKKVIVSVPERAIGASFASTRLTDHGFFADWVVDDENNLCTPGSETSKVGAVKRFLEGSDTVMVCTHATLRFAHDAVDEELFSDTLVAVDEFHHVSADEGSRLGELVRSLIANTNAHLIAMTGSYFRGDGVPVLEPSDEAKFTKVTYTYYQQLSGYKYLKTLGIGYHFYQGRYTDPAALLPVLDTDKKTILHIPSVQSGESTKDKYKEVGDIIDAIGVVERQDAETGVIFVKRHTDGKVLKVADLVQDDPTERPKIAEYLRTMSELDDIDLIIALGMAKEGFDWPYCEHALTVGYRGSLTEVIQIIGRCTRDSANKTHAQFTNLIPQPDAAEEDVRIAVNNMLKAITASLLMEQVLAPNFKFKTKLMPDQLSDDETMVIVGFKEPSTDRVRQIVEDDLNDIKAKLFQDPQMLRAMYPGSGIDPEVMNRVMVPKIIRKSYPQLTELEVEEVRQQVIADSVIKNSEVKEVGDKRFVLMAGKFVNIADLSIDLIDSVNPFQHSFEVMSRHITKQVLRLIQDAIDETRIDITEDESKILWPKILAFVKERNGERPDLRSNDPVERRMAEAVLFLQKQRREAGL